MEKVISEQEWISLLRKIYVTDSTNKTTTTKITVKKSVAIEDDSILGIPLDKLKEMHDNLVYSGFSDTEALVITAQVANGARRTS
jgi:hypothetical protein